MNEKFLKPYEPKETEGRIYQIWEKSGFFNPDNLPAFVKTSAGKPVKRTKPYTIVLPPPNVTGSLHMGHALNATIQDILIRQKRMDGYKTLWLPGTDHAGIATQNVVEKDLKKQGITRHDLGKEKFIEKVWEWKDKYGNIILDQLKRVGASCDWSRTRFTMDEDYAKAVETSFLHYYKKGWIYQGERVVNWCVRCQTSLSDLELEHEDSNGKLWYIRYPIKNYLEVGLPRGSTTSKFITVATTRPETMLGDSAIAVNPKDKKLAHLVGKTAILPLINREIPIIADRMIELGFGTGAVKVTPAHDMTDADIGQRHKLPFYKIIDQYGRMTLRDPQGKLIKGGEEYESLRVVEAREKVLVELEKLGLIEKIEDYQNRVSKCYRCNSTIEPQMSKQWFLKMDELAKNAKKAVKSGKVKFHPKKWEKVYLDWLGNIKDWCISRQIWWGHKIPLDGVDDVLDTWFSSALWPFATLGWPQKTKDMQEFYPTQTLSTARDIINLWVARMIYSGMEFGKKPPFKDVIIHSTVLTKDGRRMSKSLGTGIDPLDLIEKYGADATRFGLIYQLMGGQDMHFSEDHLLAGKKFANKIWNATRFILDKTGEKEFENLDPKQISKLKLSKEDKEIIKKLEKITKSTDKNIAQYKFGHALRDIYEFFWKDFCDQYIEEAKKTMTEENKQTLIFVLSKTLCLLHPFIPFITEEVWDSLPIKNKGLLIIEKWPK